MRSSGRYEPSVGHRNPYAPTHQHSMRSSILPLALVNAAILLLSIPVLVTGIWLAVRHPSGCVSFFQWPLIVLAAVMMVVSLVGLVGAAKRRALLLWVYLCFMTVLILLLLAFIIFAFVVTRRGGSGHGVWAGNFKEYELHECSPWFRHRLSHAHTWRRIRACLVNDHVCSDMNDKYPTQSTMFQSKLSYIESGCCKPPTECCFSFVNATNWVNPTAAGAAADCGRWSNDPQQLCFDCDSCKAALIRRVGEDWRKAAKVALAALAVMVVVYVLAWFAFLQALAHKSLYTTAQSFNMQRPQRL